MIDICINSPCSVFSATNESKNIKYRDLVDLFNPFYATGLFLYPLKASENLWFSDVFKKYRKRPVAWNGLRPIFPWYRNRSVHLHMNQFIGFYKIGVFASNHTGNISWNRFETTFDWFSKLFFISIKQRLEIFRIILVIVSIT